MRKPIAAFLAASLVAAGAALAATRPGLSIARSQTVTAAHSMIIQARCPTACRVEVKYTATHRTKQLEKSLPARNAPVAIQLPLAQATLSTVSKSRKKHVAGPIASV